MKCKHKISVTYLERVTYSVTIRDEEYEINERVETEGINMEELICDICLKTWFSFEELNKEID